MLYNLTRVVSETVGTGTLTLGAAVSGCLTFADAGVPNGAVVSYGISDGNNSEVGRGTYNLAALTLTRDTVLASTNSNGKIVCSGNEQVFITALAEDIGFPINFERDVKFSGSVVTITTPGDMCVKINKTLHRSTSAVSIALGTAANWDTVTPTDYTVAANRAGKDFYIYACNDGTATLKYLLSKTSTAPSGYTSANSTKVGGFHCLCVAVGTLSGHPLTGYVAGDILPASVWDLKWRPRSAPEGMVYSAAANIWVDIYLMSGTGVNTKSVNGGTISDSRNWMDFVDDAGAVGKRLLRDREFQLIAAGCNEGTNITGSADPATTTGHVDTAGRRMISNIGCEDVAGTIWQWLDEQGYQYDTATFSWKNVTGDKGQLYTQGTYGDVKLLAGGNWADGAVCGSRSRVADRYRWHTAADLGGRAGVEPE